jgi:PEP-CTERM motif
MTADLATCEWQGGQDRYSGTVASAVAAYGFPIATQRALIEAFERREFEAVVIDRESIRGKTHDYADLRDMHFGARGICRNVSRIRWTDQQVETALIFCAAGECVAYPAVCGNVARVRRLDADRPTEPAVVYGGADTGLIAAPDAALIAGPQSGGAIFAAVPGLPGGAVAPGGPAFTGVAPSWYLDHFVGAAEMVAPVITYTPPLIAAHVPAVPEPTTYALMLAGLCAVVAWRRKA